MRTKFVYFSIQHRSEQTFCKMKHFSHLSLFASKILSYGVSNWCRNWCLKEKEGKNMVKRFLIQWKCHPLAFINSTYNTSKFIKPGFLGELRTQLTHRQSRLHLGSASGLHHLLTDILPHPLYPKIFRSTPKVDLMSTFWQPGFQAYFYREKSYFWFFLMENQFS